MPVDVKRALADKAYLDSLTPEERQELLEKAKELGDEELDWIAGGVPKGPPPTVTQGPPVTQSCHTMQCTMTMC